MIMHAMRRIASSRKCHMPQTISRCIPRHVVVFLGVIFVFGAPNVDFAAALSWHDGQRGLQILVLAASLLHFGCRGFGGAPIMQPRMKYGSWALAAAAYFFLLGAMSSAIASLPSWAFLEWGLILALVIFSAQLAFAVSASDSTDIDGFLVWSCFFMAAAYCVKSIILYVVMLFVGSQYGMPLNVNELFPGFSNLRFFGQFSVMVTPFLPLPVLFWKPTPVRRLMIGGVFSFWWMLIIASGTRGAWISLAAGALIASLCAWPVALRWLRWHVAGATAGALIYAVLFIVLPTILASKFVAILPLDQHEGWATLSRRDELWALAIQMIAEHPWLGVGPMHFSWQPNGIGAHPHNAILQIAAEWGIPALLLSFAVVMAGVVSWRRNLQRICSEQPRSSRSMVCLALTSALTGAATHSLVDGVIVMPVSQMTLALMCGWAWGIILQGDFGPQSQPARKSLWKIQLIAATAMLAIFQGIYPVLGGVSKREQSYLDAHSSKVLYPRFWTQGWITR